MRTSTPRRLRLLAAGSVTLALTLVTTTHPAGAAPSRAQINGTGSSWSANAVNQWVSDVQTNGLQVVYTGNGSAQGRKDFANGITDFAVSDIGYQGTNKQTGEDDTNCVGGGKCRDFAYEPIVAGGTSFPYQLKVGGKLVRNLRLSGETLAKIFTYKIRNWNDAQISRDNNGRKFPSLPIIPVVHSEGSGSTAQFTTYLDAQYPGIWRPFFGRSGFTEFYPSPSGGQGIAQSGSDGVMNFVSSAAANGAIGYDEYSYPLAKAYPVAKLLNRAGYYTLPDQYNVAVALTHADINRNKNSPNYLLQDLRQVYVAPEKQAYPMSSYSYFLIPTGKNDPRMTTAKRQTLADYLNFSVCQGQKEMGPIGYSPLPLNLVQASFEQTAKLKAADAKVDISQSNATTCDNPTFNPRNPKANRLAQIAPLPPACDKQGAGPCNDDGTSPAVGTGNNDNGAGGVRTNGGGGNAPAAAGGTAGRTTGGAGGTATGAGGTAAGATAGASAGATKIDPETGQAVTTGTGAGGSGGGGQAEPAELASSRRDGMTGLLGPLALLQVIVILVLPPVLYLFVLRRRRETSA